MFWGTEEFIRGAGRNPLNALIHARIMQVDVCVWTKPKRKGELVY